jgi:PKD repeat protein
MKAITPLFALLFIYGCAMYKPEIVSKESPANKPDERRKWEYDRVKDPRTGEVPSQNLIAVYNKSLKLQENQSQAAISGVTWEERGPTNIGGRARAIIFDLKDTTYKTVYAASVSGGLFKCTDIDATTPTWSPVNEFFSSLNINCMVQDPSHPDTLYFGTGEGCAQEAKGFGIWRSTNGGSNWTQLTSLTPTYIYKLAIAASGKVYAATSSGLYESTNIGGTWTNISTVGSGHFYDVDIAKNGDVYYTKRTNPHSNIGTAAVGRYSIRSNTWSTITPTGTFERMELACAPSDSNIIYLLATGGYGSACWDCVAGFYKSSNAGSTWTSNTVPLIYDQNATATTELSRGQGWYDLSIAVDPDTANIVYAGGVDYIKSKDGGATYKQISNWAPTPSNGSNLTGNQTIHADQHILVFKPKNGSFALFGCDGGIYKTTNLRNTWPTLPTYKAINNGFNVTQFYSCAANNTVSSHNFLAGAQDNGTSRFGTAGLASSYVVIGGDGGYCFIDQDQPSNQIGSYLYNRYYKSTNSGGTFSSFSTDNTGSFINPCDLDNTNNILYAFSNAGTINRWKNVFGTASKVNFSLTGITSNITHIRVSPNNPKNVYFGTNNGEVYRITNADTITYSTTPVLLYTNNPVGGNISCIEIRKTMANTDDSILITLSNYNIAASVLSTTNGASNNPNWVDLDDENTLPNIPINWALFSPKPGGKEVILATEMGIYTCDNIYATGPALVWGQSSTGLANVRVSMLKIRSADSLMVASTYGRGLYTSLKYSTPKPIFSATKTVAYMGENIQFTDASIAATSWQWDFDNNGSIDATTQNPTWAYGSSGYKTVKLIINEIYSKVLTNYIFILPNRGLPYTLAQGGDFESNIDDFHNYTKSGTPWEWGDSAFYEKDNTPSLTNAWVTGIKNFWYVNNSESYLYTPNFNFSTTAVDTMKFDFTGLFELSFDGVRVEYSTNLGTTWLPLGTSTSSTWYNFANTAGTAVFPQNEAFFNANVYPATQKLYSVSFLSGNPSVAFRFVFKSDGAEARYGAMIDNFEITSTATTNAQFLIESVPASKAEYLGPLDTVTFYSPNGKILTTIYNLSSHNYGLTTVAIDAAGTGASNYATNTLNSKKIFQKTYTVAPTTNNSSGSYKIKLYYNKAEIDGWKAATSNLFNTANLIKCPGNIASGTIANGVYGNSPALNLYGFQDSSITATFNTGFSGFAVASDNIVLPIDLLNFSLSAQGDQINLEWSTASEINSKWFEIERSFDGKSFIKIGQLSAAGNSNSIKNYHYEDMHILDSEWQVVYYRLKQIDVSNAYKFSNVVSYHKASITHTQIISIAPNPFGNELSLAINSMKATKAELSINNMEGKAMYHEFYNLVAGKNNIYIRAQHWAAGAYILRIKVGDEQLTERIIKKD